MEEEKCGKWMTGINHVSGTVAVLVSDRLIESRQPPLAGAFFHFILLKVEKLFFSHQRATVYCSISGE
jgi:hypothetical protein